TPDNTRAYVTGEDGDGISQFGRAGVSVVDTIAQQEVAFIPLIGSSKPVPFQIVIDHAGKFAYVTDDVSSTVYILDVDPNSDTYNTCLGTVMNLTNGPNGLRGLDVTVDDKRLYVAQANRPDIGRFIPPDPVGRILIIDLDPQSNTYRQQVGVLNADQDPFAVRSVPNNPDIILFTNFLSDRTGLGIIRGAETSSPTVEQYSLEFPGAKLGSPFAVHNAVDVAITPDGMYAFVAGLNDPN